MRFGVREICDVVLKAKATQKVGKKTFYKDEPVLYFDSLKTSSLEGAATTVYATGGRGNSRLVAWEGERTLTFTMEDALISPISFSILSGAGIIEPVDNNAIYVHTTETTTLVKADGNGVDIYLSQKPEFKNSTEKWLYVMLLKEGEVITEPYILAEQIATEVTYQNMLATGFTDIENQTYYKISLGQGTGYTADLSVFTNNCTVLVDYYVKQTSAGYQIDITPDKFGGSYYLEASTLFRDQNSGADLPAEFIIPNCKVQSNFTFSMASTGDPSTFTFTLDAFPGYTRFDDTQKVLASIQVIDDAGLIKKDEGSRTATAHNYKLN